ncbi:Probable transcriptional regulatory protein pc1328 [Chlamydiales bacterium SCGC AG-110-P3]|nr:Probable transcriptional regulatory protein pc1328 [Chlamydiales bacterium SCGC AG-110-P3]
MAGHSKWANIKHRKGRADAKKGKIFSQCAKEIIAAVKMGGPDPKMNPRLRLAIQKAKQNNVPTDNVERNIKKAAGADDVHYDDVTYEIYGHGGVGIIVEAMTDNKNRTASEMRIATNKNGGTSAISGAVAFNFDRKGIIQINKSNAIEDELFMAATEAGAEDFDTEDDDVFVVVTDPVELFAVHDRLAEREYSIESANLDMIPKTYVDCSSKDVEANLKLVDWLEDLEDVSNVYHNMNVADG